MNSLAIQAEEIPMNSLVIQAIEISQDKVVLTMISVFFSLRRNLLTCKILSQFEIESIYTGLWNCLDYVEIFCIHDGLCRLSKESLVESIN